MKIRIINSRMKVRGLSEWPTGVEYEQMGVAHLDVADDEWVRELRVTLEPVSPAMAGEPVEGQMVHVYAVLTSED